MSLLTYSKIFEIHPRGQGKICGQKSKIFEKFALNVNMHQLHCPEFEPSLLAYEIIALATSAILAHDFQEEKWDF